MSSTAIAEAEQKAGEKSDEVKPERVPKDTAAELERIKQLIGAHIGVDMRSPGQVAQAEQDGEEAQKELEEQQAKEAEEAQREADEAAKQEQKALAGARSSK